MLRNNLIPERKDSPNNITLLIEGKSPDFTKLASDTWGNMNGDTFIDIGFRNKTFSAMLFNVIQQGGLFTPENQYLAGLESILPEEMIGLMVEGFGDRYDRYLTSLEVTRAPHALALLSNGFNSLRARNRNLVYFDRSNSSLSTLNFVEKEASVEKILTDFSWLKERILNGKNFTVVEEVHLGRKNYGVKSNADSNSESDTQANSESVKSTYTNTRNGKCVFLELSKFKQNIAGPNGGMRLKLNQRRTVKKPKKLPKYLIFNSGSMRQLFTPLFRAPFAEI